MEMARLSRQPNLLKDSSLVSGKDLLRGGLNYRNRIAANCSELHLHPPLEISSNSIKFLQNFFGIMSSVFQCYELISGSHHGLHAVEVLIDRSLVNASQVVKTVIIVCMCGCECVSVPVGICARVCVSVCVCVA
jgi:hypothetical protein